MQTISLLFKVLWSPAEVMFLVSKSPRALAPVLFLCLFSLVTGSLVMTKVDEADLAIKTVERARGAELSDESKEAVRANANTPLSRGLTIVEKFLRPLLLITLVTVLYFGLFSIVGREHGFKTFFSLTAFAFVPLILRELSKVITAFVVPASSITADNLGSLSPAIFLKQDSVSPVLFAAVNTIDLVTIWILALLTIGYGFAARKTLSKASCAGIVIGLFLVGVIARLAFAAILSI
jgi:Yip1 domain